MPRQTAITLLLLTLAAQHGNSAPQSGALNVVVNEIMYAPSSPEPEWIEILNHGNEPVNLKKWQIADATASRHFLPAVDIIVPAGGYLLLTRDSTALHEARGVLPCAVMSVPGFPSLNNGGDALVLFDAQERTVDSLVYRPEWGGSNGGCSLERRDADAPSTAQTTWGTCASGAGATPGFPNSILRLSYDLSVAAAFLPAGPVDTLVALVRNPGKMPAGGYALMVYDDRDFDSLAAPGELAGRSVPEEPLLPGDSLRLSFALVLPPGFHQLIAVADFPADERAADNHALCTAMRAYARGAVLVNEIMADPGTGRSEYVELLNNADGDVDLKGWGVTDLAGSGGKVLIAAAARVMHPGECLVLAADSALVRQFPPLVNVDQRLVAILGAGRLNLNNDGDAVVIRDALGVTIDSVMYSAAWHNPDLSDPSGRSLERISSRISSNDPRNWGTSVDAAGGTPCVRNSISVGFSLAASRLSCAPNPFSPDGDGIDDVVVIHYEMPVQTSIINLKIYDIRGRLIRRLANNEPGGPAGSIIWDGRDERGAVARIGVYIALLEAVNSAGALESARGLLVLARSL